MNEINYCKKCQQFTMKTCKCGKSQSVVPMKFSPVEKYTDLKREANRNNLIEKGLL